MLKAVFVKFQSNLYKKLGVAPITIIIILFCSLNMLTLIPVAAWSKVWVYGHSLAGIVDSNPAGGKVVCLSCELCVVR